MYVIGLSAEYGESIFFFKKVSRPRRFENIYDK